MQHFDMQTVQLILIAVVVAAMLLQSIVLIAVAVAMGKAARAAKEQIDEIHSAAMPIIEKSRALVDMLTPKVEKASDDVASLLHTLRVQTDDLQSAANEMIARVRGQASRLDTLTTSLLDGVDRATNFMADAVSKPARQISAILASIKAAVETLRAVDPGSGSQPASTPGDHDMFV